MGQRGRGYRQVLECFQLRKEIWHTMKFFFLQKQSNQQTSTQEHDSLLATLPMATPNPEWSCPFWGQGKMG